MTLAPDPFHGDPQAEVDRITHAAGSSFAFGMKLMRRPRREAMRAVYAFCRVVDDIADGDPPADNLTPTEKMAMLAEWRVEVDRLYSGHPRSAIGQALAGAVSRYYLPKAEFIAMIEGMETDAGGPVVAPDMAALRRYTRRVAGSVGHLSMRIFGAWRGEPSARFATHLADAIQLTNILRDVEEDAGIGRLYLPAELLAKHGAPLDPARVTGHPALPAVCADLGALAQAEFAAARALILAHDRLALIPALAMMGVYRRYLDLMEARSWARGARVSLSKWAKIASGIGAVLSPGRA